MADFGSALWNKPASGGGGGDSTPAADPVVRSLRWDDGNNSNLYKATGSTNTTWTVAMWIKRSKLSSLQYFFSWGGDGINFDANDKISIWNGSSYATSTAVFRDVSSWYHLTISCNAGTITVYVNGVSQTMSSSPSYPAWGNVYFGRWSGNTSYNFDGYLADIYGVEGSALDHTSFTESNDYGLKPKAYTGSFGTNGFHIDAQPAHDADLLVTSIDRNDGDTTFADVAQGHGLTVSGNTEHSIAVGNPFTSTGRAIDFGTDDSNYLEIWDGSTGDYNIGSDDFTMEAWYNTYDTEPYGALFGHYQDANNWFNLYVYGDKLRWYYKISGSGLAMVSDVDWQHHKWNHVAVTKSGSAHKLWLNGVQVATGTKSGSNTFSASAPLYVGTLRNSSTSFADYHGDGYAYDVRISSSIRYTSDFDVPTEKFTDDSDTELLLQPDNSDSDWDDVDKSHNSHGVTEYGTVTRTASTPYDAAAKSTAMYFDGSGDYITTSWDSASDFDFGSSDYTIECWFTVDDTNNTYKTLFGGTAFELNCFVYGTRVLFYGAAGYYTYGPYTISADTWYHVACQRNGNTLELYFDGSRADTVYWSGTHTSFTGSTPFRIGYLNGYARTHSGYIYDFRVTKGEAKYSGSTYDTPSAPFELNPVYIGGDQSGNKNHLTPTNISGHDTVLDTPTRNYATMSPVNLAQYTGTITFGEGNLSISSSGTIANKIASTKSMPSGKWYAEVRPNSRNNAMVGVCRPQDIVVSSQAAGYGGAGHVVYIYNGSVYNGSTSRTNYAFSSANGDDVVQLAVDVDNSKIWFGLNDTWQGTPGSSGGHSLDSGEQVFVYSYRDEVIWNFGQDPTFAGNKTSGQDTTQDEFYYAPPTGFSGL